MLFFSFKAKHRGVVNRKIVANELETGLRYIDHFRTNTFRKGMNPFIPLAIC